VEKVLIPHNVHPKTILLIKHGKGCGFSKHLFFPKVIIKECTKETKIIFCFLGPKINHRSYVSPFIMENHGYVVLYEKTIHKSIWKKI